MIPIKRERIDAKIPCRKTEGSAGLDLYLCMSAMLSASEAYGDACSLILTEDSPVIEVNGNCTVVIPTGWAIAIPQMWMGLILPRSSMARFWSCKSPPIDHDYRGEVSIILHNTTQKPHRIAIGDRIAQLVVVPAMLNDVVEIEDLGETARGTGGFGSTGR
jgi:dUTP pyrophosphatase